MVLGVYFALSSGTVDSVVYDTVLEETGRSDLYETVDRPGPHRRERRVSSVSALLGGVLAELDLRPRSLTSPPCPSSCWRSSAFLLLRRAAPAPRRASRYHPAQPRRAHAAHDDAAPGGAPGARARRAWPQCSSQAVFEFGPLWLVALAAPAVLFGPYWAALVATLGSRRLARPRSRPGPPPVAVAVAVPRPPRPPCSRCPGRSLPSSSPRPRWPSCSRSSRSPPGNCSTTPCPRRSGPACRRRRHLLLAAVPAVVPRARLARPRARRAADRMGAHRCRGAGGGAARRVHPARPAGTRRAG